MRNRDNRHSRNKYNAWDNDRQIEYDETEQGEDSDCNIKLPRRTKNKKKVKSQNESKSRPNKQPKQRKRKFSAMEQFSNIEHSNPSKKRRLTFTPPNDTNSILQWISAQGYSQYVDTLKPHFIDNEVDSLEALKCLDADDLKEFGMKSILHRKELKKVIDRL